MARNAKLDLAKRQAVGIYRPASPNASINHATAQYSGGDYRQVEGAKDYYRQGRAMPVDVAGLQVTQCKPGIAKGSDRLNRKGSQATPRDRARMQSYGYLKPVSIAYPKWVPAGISTLIPAPR